MSQRWTEDEDLFLLTHHVGIGAATIAWHDLGRPANAGPQRLKKLTESGAREAFARSRLARLDYLERAGMTGGRNADQERDHWQREIEESRTPEGSA